jgi:nucleoside phosphorylase
VRFGKKLCIIYEKNMGNPSKKNSAAVSTSALTPLLRPKLATSFVPRPLTVSEIDWLRREGLEFQEAYSKLKANLAPSELGSSVGYGPVDLGIIVALEEAFRELIDLCGPYTTHNDGLLTAYRFQHGSYSIVATFVGDMGESHTTRVTERMISVWHPESIVVVGIAASIHDDLRIGDVFMPTKTFQYIQNSKTYSRDGERAGFSIITGTPTYYADDTLQSAVRHFEYVSPDIYQRFRRECRQDIETLLPNESVRHRLLKDGILRDEITLVAHGNVATGPVVASSSAFFQWIRHHDRNVKAIEMEAAGVWLAAQTRDKPIRTLAIRGISDYGDDRKQRLDKIDSGALRRYAMRNAVRFLLALLDAKLLASRT